MWQYRLKVKSKFVANKHLSRIFFASQKKPVIPNACEESLALKNVPTSKISRAPLRVAMQTKAVIYDVVREVLANNQLPQIYKQHVIPNACEESLRTSSSPPVSLVQQNQKRF